MDQVNPSPGVNFTKVGKLTFTIRRGERFGVWQRLRHCQTPILLLFWKLFPTKMKYNPPPAFLTMELLFREG